MSLLIRLLIAHLLGDFVFQTKAMVDEKEAKKMRSPLLYAHVAIHFALLMLFAWDPHFIWTALAIAVAHWATDVFKSYMGKGQTWFLIDQLLHILAILLGWCVYAHPVMYIPPNFDEEKFFVVALALLFVTRPAGIIIKVIISKWEPHVNSGTPSALNDAGLYIGIMERLLIVIFILLNQWTPIGFLLASKSVFRFGDLRQAADRKLTEYILIGTLLSFSVAIITGIVASYLIS